MPRLPKVALLPSTTTSTGLEAQEHLDEARVREKDPVGVHEHRRSDGGSRRKPSETLLSLKTAAPASIKTERGNLLGRNATGND